ncbi:hypothetical protein BJ165DRAFT_1400773 [Panaeolus papilionaceus]|nr:hypothetical protein BJ165DRAFT_1400773 [Panaeolus papilionaceus]
MGRRRKNNKTAPTAANEETTVVETNTTTTPTIGLFQIPDPQVTPLFPCIDNPCILRHKNGSVVVIPPPQLERFPMLLSAGCIQQACALDGLLRKNIAPEVWLSFYDDLASWFNMSAFDFLFEGHFLGHLPTIPTAAAPTTTPSLLDQFDNPLTQGLVIAAAQSQAKRANLVAQRAECTAHKKQMQSVQRQQNKKAPLKASILTTQKHRRAQENTGGAAAPTASGAPLDTAGDTLMGNGATDGPAST